MYRTSWLIQPGPPNLFAVSMRAKSATSSIAAPTTATAFLLVSLSKMPRGAAMRTGGVAATTRPEAFPIKANDFSSRWKVAQWKSVNTSPLSDTYPDTASGRRVPATMIFVEGYLPRDPLSR
jgi:hypothetical protein